jgi:hypothetical protein
VALPPSAAPLYEPNQPDFAAQSAQLTQEQALAQNDAATATGQAAATQSISQMMGEMGVQAPVAGQ